MILVTGATGYIGEQLVRTLLEQGQSVRILARTPERGRAVFGPLVEKLNVAIGDLADRDSLARAVAGVEKVYHLASWISFSAPLAEMRAVNVDGLDRLMAACSRAGVKRVLHMSSIAAGGPGVVDAMGRLRPRTEEDLPAPLDDPYGRTKREQEEVALSYLARKLECVIVRPAAVFGPGDPEGINILLRLVKAGRLPFYLGSPQAVVNLVFVRDVVQGAIAAMERGRSGEIYNLAGANLTQEQLFGLLAQVSGGRAPRWTMPVPLLLGAARLLTLVARLTRRQRPWVHPNDIRSWTASWIVENTKAREELGLKPTDLAAALRETLVWLSENRSDR